MSVRFGEDTLIIPAFGPFGMVGDTDSVCSFVDLDLANWVTFLVSFGVATSGASTAVDLVLVTVMGSSIASTASGTLIGFDYRLSEAIATHGWGAITDGTTAGTSFTTQGGALSQRSILIDVDPNDVGALGEAHRWVGVKLLPTTTMTVNVSVTALVEPRYPGNDIPSSS